MQILLRCYYIQVFIKIIVFFSVDCCCNVSCNIKCRTVRLCNKRRWHSVFFQIYNLCTFWLFQKVGIFQFLYKSRHFIGIEAFSGIRVKFDSKHFIHSGKLFQTLIPKPLPQFQFFRLTFFQLSENISGLLIQARVFFCFHMKFCIIGKKGFNGFFYNVFLISPSSVGTNHFSKLGSVVAQVIDSYRVVSQKVINLINGIPDYSTADVSDMERLCNIRRGVLYNHFFPLSHFAASVSISFFQDLAHSILYIQFSWKEHIHISIHLLHFCKNRIAADFFCNVFCNHRRCFAQYLCQFKAGKRIISHFIISRHLYHVLQFFCCEAFYCLI